MKKRISCALLALALLLSACSPSAAATWQEQYDLGVRFLSEGNYQEAIIAFNAAIEIDPKRADAYIGLADTYMAMGDAEQARQVLENALSVVSDPGVIRSRLDGLTESAALEPTPEGMVEPTRELEPTPEQTPTQEPTPIPTPQEITWTLDNGTLTISGTGSMMPFLDARLTAWYENRDSITNIVIENGVTGIGGWAFHNCHSLVSVTIGSSVTSIGDHAFYDCPSLIDLYYNGSEVQWNQIEIDSSNTPLLNATIHYNS